MPGLPRALARAGTLLLSPVVVLAACGPSPVSKTGPKAAAVVAAAAP